MIKLQYKKKGQQSCTQNERTNAPGLVLMWHHAGICCAPCFAGGCVGVVGAGVHCVTIRAGFLCVCRTGVRCAGICDAGVRCAGACRAGVCCVGVLVPFVVLVYSSCWCLSCIALVFTVVVWYPSWHGRGFVTQAWYSSYWYSSWVAQDFLL